MLTNTIISVSNARHGITVTENFNGEGQGALVIRSFDAKGNGTYYNSFDYESFSQRACAVIEAMRVLCYELERNPE